jgi:hypothetical protein
VYLSVCVCVCVCVCMCLCLCVCFGDMYASDVSSTFNAKDVCRHAALAEEVRTRVVLVLQLCYNGVRVVFVTMTLQRC